MALDRDIDTEDDLPYDDEYDDDEGDEPAALERLRPYVLTERYMAAVARPGAPS